MEKQFRADLHCHTTCSDGILSPAELIQRAKEKQLQGVSITDHDSINAYPIAILEAKKENIDLISGVEFSTSHLETTVHILAYSFSVTNTHIKRFCQKHQERRQERNREILKLLAANNMSINEADLTASHPGATLGRPHIAWEMVKKGYVQSMSDAFHLFIGENKSCYVRGASVSIEEAIDCIHQANGFAVIAHPHLIKEPHIVKDLLKMKFDGLEGYYARMNPKQNERWIRLATKKDWLITGGSDFHGDMKYSIDLGSSWVGEDTFRILKDRFDQNSIA